ncbi:MAG: exodeoxyribonuclease VII small subunit [Paludibacteraceae bacterium]|jgi:exodeoxyribonuclease VII small subunit|nr:exodeoxyribonuclease VII small subunit [Paludibacteraceae bacterium]MBQ1970550.1 exodeoxyribonuclease VII small subunit [Paludibacteraceae bacterium]MEE0997084.1 exodeoxyribonuclease VII small subunit [Paludibacteraceae bacterium]MEE1540965.1 exodeoxyribonuclease VII small subunit [Paludibacteraceae bacterium]
MTNKSKNYSESIKELEEIVKSVENETLDLDELSKKVKRATELIKICKEKLFQTDAEIEKILESIKED